MFPGAVATNIATNSGVSIARPAAAERRASRTYPANRAARDILDGMEKDAFRVMVGSDARFLDRFYRLSPRRAAGFIADRMKDLLPA